MTPTEQPTGEQLTISPRLRDRLERWRREDCPISAALIAEDHRPIPGSAEAWGYPTVEATYQTTTARADYLDIADDADLTYTPAGKPAPAIASEPGGRYWAPSGRVKAKPARAVRKVLLDPAAFTDAAYEAFTNRVKAASARPEFEILSGIAIKRAYLESSYSDDDNLGTLATSCMRYRECQTYFKLYTENPEVCSLVVLRSRSDHGIIGRALLWQTTTHGPVLDRVYGSDETQAAFKAHAQAEGWKYRDANRAGWGSCYRDPSGEQIRLHAAVQLKHWRFHEYPYMDTFSNLDPDSGRLDNIDSGAVSLCDTGGGPDLINAQLCPVCEEWRDVDTFTWHEITGRELCEECYRDYTCSACGDELDPDEAPEHRTCQACYDDAHTCRHCGEVSSRTLYRELCEECQQTHYCWHCRRYVPEGTTPPPDDAPGASYPETRACQRPACQATRDAELERLRAQRRRDAEIAACPISDPYGAWISECPRCGHAHNVWRDVASAARHQPYNAAGLPTPGCACELCEWRRVDQQSEAHWSAYHRAQRIAPRLPDPAELAALDAATFAERHETAYRAAQRAVIYPEMTEEERDAAELASRTFDRYSAEQARRYDVIDACPINRQSRYHQGYRYETCPACQQRHRLTTAAIDAWLVDSDGAA